MPSDFADMISDHLRSQMLLAARQREVLIAMKVLRYEAAQPGTYQILILTDRDRHPVLDGWTSLGIIASYGIDNVADREYLMARPMRRWSITERRQHAKTKRLVIAEMAKHRSGILYIPAELNYPGASDRDLLTDFLLAAIKPVTDTSAVPTAPCLLPTIVRLPPGHCVT